MFHCYCIYLGFYELAGCVLCVWIVNYIDAGPLYHLYLGWNLGCITVKIYLYSCILCAVCCMLSTRCIVCILYLGSEYIANNNNNNNNDNNNQFAYLNKLSRSLTKMKWVEKFRDMSWKIMSVITFSVIPKQEQMDKCNGRKDPKTYYH